MSGLYLRQYAIALDGTTPGSLKIRLKLRQAGSDAFATSAHWTPAAGDVTVSKDFGVEANIATLPSYINGWWEVTLSEAELTAKQIGVTFVNPAIVPEAFVVETFGDAEAMYGIDWSGADADLLAVKAKTDLIGVGGLAIRSATIKGKQTTLEIVRGDSYGVVSTDDKVEYVDELDEFRDFSTATFTFTIRERRPVGGPDGAIVISVTDPLKFAVGLVSGHQSVSVILDSAVTAAAAPGNDYEYDLQASWADGQVDTLVGPGALAKILADQSV